VGAGLIALAVVAVVGFTLASEDQTATEEEAFLFPDVTVSGSILPPHANTGEDAAVGLAMPEVFSADFSGQPASIENDGVPKMIMFLAHWCSHCQREVASVQPWIDDNGIPAGVDLVSVATSIDEIRPNYPPDAWLEREGWTPRVVVDSQTSRISNAFGLSAFPFYVLVDGSGTVVRRIAGGLDPAVVGSMLDALAAGG
jgi:thiol-disulfide isomerase/thioredoxin